MTTMTAGGRVPEFTLGWRLRLALDTAGVSVQEMADRLGYSRSSVSRWLNDQGDPPRAAVMSQWALITGVSPAWLKDGHESPTPPDGGSAAGDQLARLAERKRSRIQGRGRTNQYRGLVPAMAAAA